KGPGTLDEAGVPAFTSLASCAAALGAALEFHTRPARETAVPSARTPPRAAAEGRGPLPWAEARHLLREAGVTMAPDVVVGSAGEAVEAAGALGYPVAGQRLGPARQTGGGGGRRGWAPPVPCGRRRSSSLARAPGRGRAWSSR